MALILAYTILAVIIGYVIFYIVKNTPNTGTNCTQDCEQGRYCTCLNNKKGDRDGSSNN